MVADARPLVVSSELLELGAIRATIEQRGIQNVDADVSTIVSIALPYGPSGRKSIVDAFRRAYQGLDTSLRSSAEALRAVETEINLATARYSSTPALEFVIRTIENEFDPLGDSAALSYQRTSLPRSECWFADD